MKEGCNLIVGCPGKLRQIFEDKLFIELVKLNKLEYLVFGNEHYL
jgi:superfamily II DNA/RNA helicase